MPDDATAAASVDGARAVASVASVDDLVQNGLRAFLSHLSRTSTAPLGEVLDDVVVASTTLLADIGVLWLVGDDGLRLTPAAGHDPDPSRRLLLGEVLAGIRPSLSLDPRSRVALGGEPWRSRTGDPDPGDGDRDPVGLAQSLGAKATLLLPLTTRGRTIGVLELLRVRRPGTFTDEDVARGLELATHAAAFVDGARLTEALRHQAALVDDLHDAVIGLDRRGSVTSWNRSAARLYGIGPDAARGRLITELVQMRSADADAAGRDLFAEVMAAVATVGRWQGRVVHRGPDGGDRHVELRVSATVADDGRLAGAVVVARDRTAEAQAEAALAVQERLARTVLDALPHLTAVVDRAGLVIAVNEAWDRQARQQAPRHGDLGVGLDYLGALRRAGGSEPLALESLAGLERVLEGSAPAFELDYDLEVGQERRAFVMSAVPLPGGGAVVSHQDITWRKTLERQLSFHATHDSLTGLPNRLLLHDRLVQALNRAARSRSQVGVLFCDLDQFKVLNDTLGHAAGDQVLVAVARRLEHALRASDSVTRFGGDEFVVVVEDVESPAVVELIAQRLLDTLTTPIRVDDSDLWFGASIGVVVSDGEVRATREHVDGLIRDADTAMYRAKEGGRNRIAVFDPSMRTAVATRLELTMSLRTAVAEGQLLLEYQPQFACSPDGPVVGAEALLRWRHPERGLVPPGEFIAAAEESGVIVEIGLWVLDEACRQVARWRESLPRALPVAVNLSPRQLHSRGLVEAVESTLHRHRLDPALLRLELTEGALMQDPEQAAVTLRELRELGVALAVDDFGTGHSSLAHLQHFPVDELKIDRSFVARVLDAPKTMALVLGMVQLGHALDLRVVAEGVETPAQLEAVTELGCDVFQGFLRSRPVSASEVAALVTGSGAGR